MWRKVVFLFLISFCTNVLGNENYYLMSTETNPRGPETSHNFPLTDSV